MKSRIVFLTFISVFTPTLVFAQHTTPPEAPANQETLDWLKERALKSSEENNFQMARGSATREGQLIIIPLAEWDAPASAKDSVARGIANQSKGTLKAASGSIPSTDEVLGRLADTRRSDAELRQLLGYAPAEISRTPIGAAELLSTEPTGSFKEGKWTGVTRSYRVPKVGVIILEENDYIASGRVITLFRETLNENVNGTPARASASRSDDGKGQAELRWVTPQRSFTLTLYTDEGNRIEQGQALLLQIAKGIKS